MTDEPKCLRRWRKQCATLRQQYQEAQKIGDRTQMARLSRQMSAYAEVSRALVQKGASKRAWQA